ncbi:MAG: hypothetical protein ACFFCE_01720 [Promethearchaeota archaeon]
MEALQEVENLIDFNPFTAVHHLKGDHRPDESCVYCNFLQDLDVSIIKEARKWLEKEYTEEEMEYGLDIKLKDYVEYVAQCMRAFIRILNIKYSFRKSKSAKSLF